MDLRVDFRQSLKKGLDLVTGTKYNEGTSDEIKALDVNVVEKVVKHEFTEADLVSGKITLTGTASYFEIVNKNNSNGLSFTIGGVTITLDRRDVDTKGIPLVFSFGDDFAPFTEIAVSGTALSFKAIVKG